MVPGCLIAMFKSGPFAWNGLLAFWMPAIAYALWVMVMILPMLKAVGGQSSDGGRIGKPAQA
jgi:hypothetical protein